MRNAALARRAEELSAQGAAYVTATVVRAQRPTSARAGNVALVTSDGTIQGFVGGICSEHSVRLFAWTAMQTGEPVLLRILPETNGEGADQKQEDGAVTVLNTCLSGGAIEVFLEPTLPIPRVNVVGSKPIAAEIERLGAEFDLDVVATGDEPANVREGDLAMVIAAHGKGELEALKAAIDAKLPYIGLVASPKRGKALLEELRAEGVADEDLARVKCPAGINIGARTPPEVALTCSPRSSRRATARTTPRQCALRRPGCADVRDRSDLRHDGRPPSPGRCISSMPARRSTSALRAARRPTRRSACPARRPRPNWRRRPRVCRPPRWALPSIRSVG